MENRKIMRKTAAMLFWLIIVCAVILVRTNAAGHIWQLVYAGIYGTADGSLPPVSYADAAETEVYRYMNYWEAETRELCESAAESEPGEAGAADGTSGASDGGEAGNSGQGEPVSDKTAADKTAADKTAADKAATDKAATGETDTGKAAEDKAAADKAAIDANASQTVAAMADISSSYIGMDSATLFSYCYNSAHAACITDDELNAENLLGKDLSIDKSTGGYKVLIYHTHSSETFADSREGVVEDTIVGVGSRLAEILSETYGISVYHDTSEYDMMSGVLDRDIAYDYSRAGVQKILGENPTIEVIIDLHRDGVADDVHLVTDVNGRQTAKVMMVNGMSRNSDGTDKEYLPNAYRKDNLACSLQMYLAGRAGYGDFVRKIYLSTSRYNMDLMPRAMLIEAGAQTNTLEEEMNAMEPLAAMLAKVLLE